MFKLKVVVIAIKLFIKIFVFAFMTLHSNMYIVVL